MASADILRAARARISDPKNWTTGFYAYDDAGNELMGNSKLAVCWCALGAVHAEGKSDSSPEANLLNAIALSNHGMNIADVNDNGTHAEVLAVFDAAIAAAEREAGQ